MKRSVIRGPCDWVPGFRFAPSGLRRGVSRPARRSWSSFGDNSAPILRQQSGSNVSVKGRVGPVASTNCEPMLDRIEMDVVEVPRKVFVIADRMLPESSLPQHVLALGIGFDRNAVGDDASGEEALQPAPPAREIGIILRKRKDRMEVIWQDHDRVDRKGALASGDANAERKEAMWSTRADERRFASVTVKKNVPPGTKLRRYRTIGAE